MSALSGRGVAGAARRTARTARVTLREERSVPLMPFGAWRDELAAASG